MKQNRRFSKKEFLVFSILGVLALGLNFLLKNNELVHGFKNFVNKKNLEKFDVHNFLGKPLLAKGYLNSVEFRRYEDKEVLIQYSVDDVLQRHVYDLLKSGHVSYGAFVAIDPTTGKVKAMVSLGSPENMTLKASFPSASVFKVVTAAAAIENKKLSVESLIPMKGSFHTLYKSNIMRSGGLLAASAPGGVRFISLSEAFSKSVNSVFAKIGIFGLGADGLKNYASHFLFNKSIPFEMAVEESTAVIPNDEFGLAESASGFTRLNRMSPLHGALIASAIANEGLVLEPTIVEQLYDKENSVEYVSKSTPLIQAVSSQTSVALRAMMMETITKGTSRDSFRGFRKHPVLSQLELGGKTGTLDGDNPKGRYDWFVGYGMRGSEKLALAALCIHGEYRGVKAAQVARKAFEVYFRPSIAKIHRSGSEKLE